MGTTRRAIMLTAAALLVVASPLVGDVTDDDPSRGLQPARTAPSGAIQPTGTPPNPDLDPGRTTPNRALRPLLSPTFSEPAQPDRALVPEGHLTITQRFIAGITSLTPTRSPVGTTERPRAISAVPTGLRAPMPPHPSDESLGYSQLPLRGTPGKTSARAGLQPARTPPSPDLEPAPTTPSRDRLSFTSRSDVKGEGVDLAHLSAHEAVREGNSLLEGGDPAGALEAYRRAEELRPDTREVPFVQGLAHFALGEHEQARQEFEMATAAMEDALAFDAEYGIGTTYHAQALANLDNPPLAISHFEDAMQRYQSVLSSSRDHEAAREANLKAGTMWRQLKQLLEEQEQQQDQEQNDNEEQSPEEQSQQQDENEQQENDDQQSPQEQQQQDKQEENEKEQQAQDPEQQDGQEQQQQEAQQKEQQALREQAQRRLREMMQALRQRKKERDETEVQTVPVAPVDKDW